MSDSPAPDASRDPANTVIPQTYPVAVFVNSGGRITIAQPDDRDPDRDALVVVDPRDLDLLIKALRAAKRECL